VERIGRIGSLRSHACGVRKERRLPLVAKESKCLMGWARLGKVSKVCKHLQSNKIDRSKLWECK